MSPRFQGRGAEETSVAGRWFRTLRVLPRRARSATLSIMQPLDVLEDRVRELNSGAPAHRIEQLDLHASPEGLGDGVVVWLSG